MKVNGTNFNLDKNVCLYDYLINNKYDITKIAVEHNGNIIPKNNYKNITLTNKDTLEIVSFVGGG